MTNPLGLKMKDRITGFEGVVTGYVQYLTGCNQALLAPKVGKDGSAVDSRWFDEQRLENVGGEGARITLENGANPGPDKPAPSR